MLWVKHQKRKNPATNWTETIRWSQITIRDGSSPFNFPVKFRKALLFAKGATWEMICKVSKILRRILDLQSPCRDVTADTQIQKLRQSNGWIKVSKSHSKVFQRSQRKITWPKGVVVQESEKMHFASWPCRDGESVNLARRRTFYGAVQPMCL